ncbi:MAG: response regulator [Gemmatimonadetes bacterium]|nr:response regulator [Gemmatimonadota bacterium]
MEPREHVQGSGTATLRAAFWVLAVHAAVFTFTDLGIDRASQPQWMRTYGAFGFLPLQLGTAVALATASRRRDLPEGTRAALRAIAMGFGALTLGAAVWFIMYLIGRPLRYISWADLIYFQFYPFLIHGVTRLPRTTWTTDRLRDALGLIVVLVAFGSLIIFAARVDATNVEFSTGQRFLITATAMAQLATLVAINKGLERARRIPSRVAVTLLLGCIAVSTIADLVFQILFSTQYTGPNWSVAVAVAVDLGIFHSAILFIETPLPKDDTDDASRTPFSPLPILAVSSMALLLVWMSTTGQATNLGALVGGLVLLNATLVVRDVTTSRAATQAVQADTQREAARRLEALVRHASDAILLLDQQGNVAFASAPTDRLFGASISASEGRRFAGLVSEESRDEWERFLAGLGERPGRPGAHVWRLRGRDGMERLVESIGVDLRDEPAVHGTVLNLRDVTERLLLEDRLRQAQKLEVAGRLAGGVAHDFNNVLTAVMASAELAQLTLGPDHAAQSDLSGIGAAARRGAALTRRLLAFVRNDPAPAQRVDVVEMVRDLEPLLTRLAGESHPITVRAPEPFGSIEVDRAELEHILFNLVANARDAMPNGGPIELAADVRQVGAAARDADFTIAPLPGRYAVITVSDRGIGMSDEVRERMFDPFFTDKSGGRGTGLGLIGVRPLIERAGGGLRVDSSPGSGTAVMMMLPLVTAEEPAAPRRRSGEVRTTPSKGKDGRIRRILLVEDELAVREQLTRLLEAMGHATVAAATAAEARTHLVAGSAPFDAVVSDVMMPGETGIQFTAWLRQAHPELPVLLISGHTGESVDRETLVRAGVALLRKPFSGAELARELNAILERPASR